MLRRRNIILTLVFLTGSLWAGQSPSAEEFASSVSQFLPLEEAYHYHRKLKTGPLHSLRRDPRAEANSEELEITSGSWTIVINSEAGTVLALAAEDFQDYLSKSMQVEVSIEKSRSLADLSSLKRVVVAGTREQMPQFGSALEDSKDYRLIGSEECLMICGGEELGVAYGLYNLESRMNLREGPFLPRDLNTTRRSHYQTRMILNWLGWMEWPDNYLSLLAHDGFDAIFASVYANPNGVPLNEVGYSNMRIQNPERMQDLIERAARFGIKVYAPILYRYTGSDQNEAGLRLLVQDIIRQFPEIQGYVLLTEGFYYDTFFGAGGHGSMDLREWARHWCRAVGIVAEECHKLNPDIEVLPWEYNIDFVPEQIELKRYVVNQLPRETIPLLTWENGKSFEMQGLRGYLRDYSISQIGPAEVTEAQIAACKRRGMRVYCKADTFASWQFGTTPYIPVPYQWHRRYGALRDCGVDGTLECWSNGYKPSFVTEIRAWYCWSDAPPLEELLRAIARRDFGGSSETGVIKAWKHFSKAIQLVPDTGPSMGTSNAVANPIFFLEPRPRTMTLKHSWWDQQKWSSWIAGHLLPCWPYAPSYLVFRPDFSNKVNMAEEYARAKSGVARREQAETLEKTRTLPVFNSRLLLAADELEKGLKEYRRAALQAPASKKTVAFREVLLVEQMQRMLRSCQAILEFEDLRFQLVTDTSDMERDRLLGRMSEIIEEEVRRTQASLEAAQRDSRLGYQMEADYIYTPSVLQEKLQLLRGVLDDEIPAFLEIGASTGTPLPRLMRQAPARYD